MTQRIIFIGAKPTIVRIKGVSVGIAGPELARITRFAPRLCGDCCWTLTGVGEPAHWLCAEARKPIIVDGTSLRLTRIGQVLESAGAVCSGIVMAWDGMEDDVTTCADFPALMVEVERQIRERDFGEVCAKWIR